MELEDLINKPENEEQEEEEGEEEKGEEHKLKKAWKETLRILLEEQML